jgi:hypothetical protein
MQSNFQPDSVVQTLQEMFLERAKKGKLKYGTDLDRTDLEILDWIQHFREELMDGLLYITRIEQDLKKKLND